PESGRLISAESLKTDESLLYKDADSTSWIGCAIRSAKPQLSLRRGRDCVGRQANQGWLLEFKHPIVGLELPTQRNAEQRSPITVITVSRVCLEKVPVFKPKSQAAT